MGISGLLPVLKSITETKSIEEYRGQTLAIDGYCWLHRAIYSCSQEICLGQETDKYVTYFMDRITALQHKGVIPYVVFDGGPLPMKKGTEEERRKSRQKNRELGIQHFHSKRFSEARKCFVRGADVSPSMAHRVIQQLKLRNVLYVVAPYEADAQLAYLVKNGFADGVITEDSDCLPFGCEMVLFKLDRDNVAQEIRTTNLKRNKGMRFHMFTEQMFLEMCIFSGCDYLPSIPGFGLKKAYAAMKQHGSFTKIIRALRLEGKVRIPATYEDDFQKAVLTFRHQRVYCPTKKELVPLTPIPPRELEHDPDMDFMGPVLLSDIAKAIADGDMDPITLKPFVPLATSKLVSAQNPTAALPKPRAGGTASFFRASESAAAAVFNAPRTGPASAKRNLPPSFMDKWTSKASLTKEKCSRVTITDSTAIASPLVASRYFEGNATKMSPPDESMKKSLSRSTSSLFDQIQEPRGVDTARSISVDLQSSKSRISRKGEIFKENKEPNETHEEVLPPSKETAFSRMMRAGLMLRQYKVKKRRTFAHQAPLSSQVESSDTTKSSSTSSDESEERSTTTLASGDEEGHDCPPTTLNTENGVDIVDMTADEKIDPSKVDEESLQTPMPSFDQFRFQR